MGFNSEFKELIQFDSVTLKTKVVSDLAHWSLDSVFHLSYRYVLCHLHVTERLIAWRHLIADILV